MTPSRAPLLAIALAFLGLLPSIACASDIARMSAKFTPEHLGRATAVSFAFHLQASGSVPPPLAAVSIVYPRNLGLATSGLGLAPCPIGKLEAVGPSACPPNSHMGSGTALIELQLGPAVVYETVRLTLLAGPSPDGYLHLLIYAYGDSPVVAAVVLSAVLLPGHLNIVVPPIPSVPEAPYVSLAELHITLGGNLTYYQTINGESVPYRPAGVGLPDRCPPGGFVFASTFDFLNGSHSRAQTAVACPRHRQRQHRS